MKEYFETGLDCCHKPTFPLPPGVLPVGSLSQNTFKISKKTQGRIMRKLEIHSGNPCKFTSTFPVKCDALRGRCLVVEDISGMVWDKYRLGYG